MPQTRRATAKSRNNQVVSSRLPDEIISEAFLTGLYSFELGTQESIKYLNTTTAVCGLWRRIALANPRLWVGVSYGPGTSLRPPDDAQRIVDNRVNAYLQRSKDAQIILRVPEHHPTSDTTTRRVLELIRSNAHRLCGLNIHVSSQHMLDTLFPLPASVTKLRVLSIGVGGGRWQSSDKLVQIFNVNGTPRELLHLALNTKLRWDVSRIPSHSLTSLAIVDIGHSPQTTSILSYFRSVVKLQVCSRSQDIHPPFQAPGIGLPDLTTLHVRDTLPLTFHQTITCSSLETLVVVVDRESSWWNANAGPLGVEPPLLPKLRHLALSQADLAGNALQTFMSMNSTIVTLQVYRCRGTIPFLSSLAKSESSEQPQLLPDLRKFGFDQPCTLHSSSDDMKSIEAALISAMKRRPQLKAAYRHWGGFARLEKRFADRCQRELRPIPELWSRWETI